MSERAAPLVLLAAGGTGGHLFPAEALAVALARRGIVVDLATDERATRYGHDFPARATHVIPSATIRGRDPISMVKTLSALALGAGKALLMLRRTQAGIDRNDFQLRTGFALDTLAGNVIERFTAQGYLEDDGRRVRLSPQGVFLADRVFCELI